MHAVQVLHALGTLSPNSLSWEICRENQLGNTCFTNLSVGERLNMGWVVRSHMGPMDVLAPGTLTQGCEFAPALIVEFRQAVVG